MIGIHNTVIDVRHYQQLAIIDKMKGAGGRGGEFFIQTGK